MLQELGENPLDILYTDMENGDMAARRFRMKTAASLWIQESSSQKLNDEVIQWNFHRKNYSDTTGK
jgi:hypothetical protein